MPNQGVIIHTNVSGKLKVKHPRDINTRNCLIRGFLLSTPVLVQSTSMSDKMPNFDCLGARLSNLSLSTQFLLRQIS